MITLHGARRIIDSGILAVLASHIEDEEKKKTKEKKKESSYAKG